MFYCQREQTGSHQSCLLPLKNNGRKHRRIIKLKNDMFRFRSSDQHTFPYSHLHSMDPAESIYSKSHGEDRFMRRSWSKYWLFTPFQATQFQYSWKMFHIALKNYPNTELLHSHPTQSTVSITGASCIHPTPIRHSVFSSIFIIIKGADCNSLHQLLKPQW